MRRAVLASSQKVISKVSKADRNRLVICIDNFEILCADKNE